MPHSTCTMTGVRKVDLQSATAKEDFNASLLETGFAVVTNHGIDPQLIAGVYDEWCAFLKKLAATPELREKYMRNVEVFDGYFPMDLAETAATAKVPDLKQYFQIYKSGRFPTVEEGVSDLAKQMFDQNLALGRKLLTWIDEQLNDQERAKLTDADGEGHATFTNLSETLSDERTMMRILHYPAYEDASAQPGQVRSAPHEDINWLTVLPAGSAKGLQLCLDGETWVDVPYERDSIVINIGDMLHELTSGRYRSTTHRVIKHPDDPPTAERMSVPCFIHPKAEVFLSKKYPTAETYLAERLALISAANAEKK